MFLHFRTLALPHFRISSQNKYWNNWEIYNTKLVYGNHDLLKKIELFKAALKFNKLNYVFEFKTLSIIPTATSNSSDTRIYRSLMHTLMARYIYWS